MSRIGKKPIIIPNNVKINVVDRDLSVEGPKGKLELKLHPFINIQTKDSNIIVSCDSESESAGSIHGMSRTLISNMIKGVMEGFTKELEIVGVGFRAQVQANILNLQLGFSHDVKFPIPEDIKISCPKQNQIVITGIDKIKVGEVAAGIRRIFPPEPYKGKGIRYVGEYVRKKLGKVVAK